MLSKVTSSTGDPYTLYLTLPPLLPSPPDASHRDTEIDRPPSPSPAIDTSAEPATPTRPRPRDIRSTDSNAAAEAHAQAMRLYQSERVVRIRQLAQTMSRMYCPCAGFLFNSLGGEKNYLASPSTSGPKEIHRRD